MTTQHAIRLKLKRHSTLQLLEFRCKQKRCFAKPKQPARLPEDHAGEVLLLRGVPLAGQQHGEGVTGVGDEAGLVGHLAEHVGRVTVSSAGGLSAADQGSGTGQGAQGSAAALRNRSKRTQASVLCASLPGARVQAREQVARSRRERCLTPAAAVLLSLL